MCMTVLLMTNCIMYSLGDELLSRCCMVHKFACGRETRVFVRACVHVCQVLMKNVSLERDYYTHHVMTLTVAVCDH